MQQLVSDKDLLNLTDEELGRMLREMGILQGEPKPGGEDLEPWSIGRDDEGRERRGPVMVRRQMEREDMTENKNAEPEPTRVSTREEFDDAVDELFETGRPIEAPSVEALEEWAVDLEDEGGGIEGL